MPLRYDPEIEPRTGQETCDTMDTQRAELSLITASTSVYKEDSSKPPWTKCTNPGEYIKFLSVFFQVTCITTLCFTLMSHLYSIYIKTGFLFIAVNEKVKIFTLRDINA